MRLGRFLTAFLAAGLALLPANAAEPPARVMLFTHSGGFKHDSVPTSVEVMKAVAERTDVFTIGTVSEDLADLTAETLARHDVLFLYTTGNWPISDAQKQALLDWVKAGGGVLGIHSATDTNYTWAEYGELIGGYFDGHPWHEEITAVNEAPNHPATRHWPARFNVTDEIYQHRNWSREKTTVLLSLDPSSVDINHPSARRRDNDYALAWCHAYGQGRVLYSTLGHRHEVWRSPDFQEHLIGSVLWLARLDWQSDAQLAGLLDAGSWDELAALASRRQGVLRDELLQALAHHDSAGAGELLVDLTGEDTEQRLRMAAIRALGQRQPGGLAPLLALAADADSIVRRVAARELGWHPGEASLTALRGLLGDRVPGVRRAALEGLARLGGEAALATLLDVATGEDTLLRGDALALLPSPGESAGVREALVKLVTDPSPALDPIRPQLADRLGPAAGQDAVFALLRDLAVSAERPSELRAAALRAIAAGGREEARELVRTLFFDPDGLVARQATNLAARVGLQAAALLGPFIPRWMVAGPFPNPNSEGFNRDFGPEAAGVDPRASYDTLLGQRGWQLATLSGDRLDFRKVWPERTSNVTAYAFTTLTAPREMQVQLRLGSDDGARAWLNGTEILARNVPRGLTIDDDIVPITLRPGRNELLVKVIQGGGDWSLTARLASPTGDLGEVTVEVDSTDFQTGFVPRWLVVGPFANEARAAHQAVLPAETATDLTATFAGVGGQVAWRPVVVNERGLLNLLPLFERKNHAAALALVDIIAPEDLACDLLLGSDDGCRAWLNGQLVLDRDVDRGFVADADRVPVQLRAGSNRLLVKVLQQTGDWSLAVRLERQAGGMGGIAFRLPIEEEK